MPARPVLAMHCACAETEMPDVASMVSHTWADGLPYPLAITKTVASAGDGSGWLVYRPTFHRDGEQRIRGKRERLIASHEVLESDS